MLSQLVAYTYRKGLIAEPGFSPRQIRWIVRLNSSGQLSGVIPVGDDKKGKAFHYCPYLTPTEKKSSEIRKALEFDGKPSDFLLGDCSVVALIDGGTVSEGKDLEEKHTAFKKFLELASQSVQLVVPVLALLSNQQEFERLRSELKAVKARPTDKVSFQVGDELLLDSGAVHEWWREFYQKAFPKQVDVSNNTHICLATGKEITLRAEETHPPITKLGVGANTSGATLVSFDKDAFMSYGLERSLNAPIATEAAKAYTSALNELLGRNIVVGKMKIAVWYDSDIPEEDDPLFWLIQDEKQANEQAELVALEKVEKLMRAFQSGQISRTDLGNSRYYALSMSGAAGRVMIRDWQTGTLASFVHAVREWLTDLAIVNRWGDRRARLPGLQTLLESIPKVTGEDTLDSVKNLQTPLWRAALNPRLPIPYAAIAKIMETHTAEVMTGAFGEALKAQKPDAAALGRIYARMGLLKAYHNRKGGYRMSAELDLNHPSPAYHCGRLMCLLAQIQEAASESDINAGVIQRYYGAASSTPSLVLGRLTRLSQHHLAKMAKDAPRLAYWFNSQLAEVWKALGKNLPRTLSLEEQSLFALGYYQQLAASRKKETPPTQAPSAPDLFQD